MARRWVFIAVPLARSAVLFLSFAAVLSACGAQPIPSPVAKAIVRLRAHGGMGIFLDRLGTIHCRVAEGGPMPMGPPTLVPARCRTDVKKGADGGFVLTFTEMWRLRDFRGRVCYDTTNSGHERCNRQHPVNGFLQHQYRFSLNRAGLVTKERQSGDLAPEQVP